MSALSAHRSLGARLRSELYRNVCLLSLRRPMLQDLCLMLNGGPQVLDKLNQALFVHLSYYLASIIEPKMAQLITWPLYDKASERTYKTQLYSFISMYYTKAGSTEKDKWITPIQPSYLNAGGFKVMQLLFEMSQLALSKMIRNDFKVTGEKLEACDLSKFNKHKEKLDAAVEKTRKELAVASVKFVMYKKRTIELSELYKKSITDLETEYESVKNILNSCIDHFAKDDPLGLINDIKDVQTPSIFLHEWNDSSDNTMSTLETEWSENTKGLIDTAMICRQTGKLTVSRNTSNDKSAYTIEYNPDTDKFDTEQLESQVSSQQRYILKNIIKDDTLNFPNLLRGYAVAMCYMFKNVRCVEPAGQFNQHLSYIAEGYGQLRDKGKWLVDEMHRLELKLQKNAVKPQTLEEDSDSADLLIPPLPDLRFQEESWQNQVLSKEFTPLLMSKVQFNIRNYPTADVRQPRSLFQVPVTISRPTTFKSIAKVHGDELMTSHCLNATKISNPTKDLNKTTADCSTGFTQQQLNRLLSSRKSSSKKTQPAQNPESHSKVKRSNLFKETPDNSFSMIRSVSSPNINYATAEMKKKSFAQNRNIRNLYAIAQEESPDRPLEISGVTSLQSSKNCTPQKNVSLSVRKSDFRSMPVINVPKLETAPCQDTPMNEFLRETSMSSIVDNLFDQPCKKLEPVVTQPEIATPPVARTQAAEKKKANSIERLIEKYKKIRHNTSKAQEKLTELPILSPITDLQQLDKENDFNEINVDTSFSGRLPDLVSPSNNASNSDSSIVTDWVIEDTPVPKGRKKCRESLGAALGVDNTFLDQFDLIE